MQCLLVPMGTPGDVQPFFDLGCALLSRGHGVRMLAHDPFRTRAESYGFKFDSIGTNVEFDCLLNDRNLWNPVKAYRVFAKKLVIPTMRPIVEAIRKHQSSETIVFAQSMALGARIAQDAFDIRTITVHRQPSFVRSMDDTSKGPSMLLPQWLPRPIKRAQFRVIDAIIDHPYVPPVNELRQELGLPPIARWSKAWLNSKDGIIGFWNDFFAPPQQDWPGGVTLAGFIASETGEREMSDELRRFLDDGEPPVAFTFGSGNRFSSRLLKISADACQRIHRRGILVSRDMKRADDLPKGLLFTNYAPFSQLLPRCAAVVHHAGIGTVGQSLAAGLPQLCVSGLVFDTVDTAYRLQKLGVSRQISVSRYSVNRASHALASLLAEESAKSRARALSTRVRSVDALTCACELAERLMTRV